MIICDSRKPIAHLRYCDLAYGEVFVTVDGFFMKTDYAAVNLETGHLVHVEMNAEVECVDAKIIIHSR